MERDGDTNVLIYFTKVCVTSDTGASHSHESVSNVHMYIYGIELYSGGKYLVQSQAQFLRIAC